MARRLYTEENQVATLLTQLHQQHANKQEEELLNLSGLKPTGDLRDRLDAVKDALSACMSAEQGRQYRLEIRKIREEIDQAMTENKERERQMRATWAKLKAIRTKQRFNSSTIKMNWRRKAVDAGAAKAALDEQVEERLDEYRAEYDAKVAEYEARIEQVRTLAVDKQVKMAEAEAAKDEPRRKKYSSAVKRLSERLDALEKGSPVWSHPCTA